MDICESPIASRVSSHWRATSMSATQYPSSCKRGFEPKEQLQQCKRRKVSLCTSVKQNSRMAAAPLLPFKYDPTAHNVDSMDVDIATCTWKGGSLHLRLTQSSPAKKGFSIDHGCMVHRTHGGVEVCHPSFRPLRLGYVDEMDLKLEHLFTSYKLQQITSRQRFRPTEAVIAEDDDMMFHAARAQYSCFAPAPAAAVGFAM